MREVLHGRAFGEKLGIHAHTEVDAGALSRSLLQLLDDGTGGRPGHHRALDDHDVEVVGVAQCQADLAGGGLHVAQIDLAVARGCPDRDERQLRFQYGGPQVARGAQVPAGMPLQQLGQARLVNRRVSRVDHLDLAAVDIDADDAMALVRKAHAGDQTDVARADDRDSHGFGLLLHRLRSRSGITGRACVRERPPRNAKVSCTLRLAGVGGL